MEETWSREEWYLNADFVDTEFLFGFGRRDVMPRPLKA